jgi:hypothetical protein
MGFDFVIRWTNHNIGMLVGNRGLSPIILSPIIRLLLKVSVKPGLAQSEPIDF